MVEVRKVELAEMFRLVPVALVKVRTPRLVTPLTFKLVEVAPIPVTSSPPLILVKTPEAPIEMVPVAPPVPMLIVVVPGPVPRLMVDDVPIPRLSVCAKEELPTVIEPVPWGAPITRAPESEAGLSLLRARLVPVAEVKVVLERLAKPETYQLVVVPLVEVTLVKMAVEAPPAPMGVFLMVPASMVKPSTTSASVTELLGRSKAPLTYRLVVVALVEETLVAKKLVEVMEVAVKVVKEVSVVKVMAPLENCINGVPVTEVADE